MLFNKDIDSYFIEFLTIPQLGTYSILSRSTNKLFRTSKYYLEYISCTYYSLYNICQDGNINLLKKALTEFHYTDENLDSALVKKCDKGQIECVKLLNSKGANCRFNDDLPIQRASESGCLEIVKFLVGVGADCRAADNYAIQ